MVKPLALETLETLTWKDRVVTRAIQLIEEGKEITADDLHDIGEPSTPNAWGQIFKDPAFRAIAECKRFTVSKRPGRNGSAIRVWGKKHGHK